MSVQKFEEGDKAIVNSKHTQYDAKNYGIYEGMEVTILSKNYSSPYYTIKTGKGSILTIMSSALDKEVAKSNREKFLEHIEKAEAKIEATKAYISEMKAKIEFMDEIKSDVFDENEFKAYQTLTIIEQSDMSKLDKARAIAQLISKKIKSHKIIVTKSTVPIGTGDKIEKILNKNKKKEGLFTVVSNPEFLREGEAIKDFKYPDRIVIGANERKVIKIFNDLYRPLVNKGAAFVSCSRRAAELIKYASNAFLATKISFINEIANLCEKVHVNVDDVALGIGLDKRIGSRFLRAGPAYGGSCFPKDTKALAKVGKNYNSPLSIVNTVINFNENRKRRIYFC